MYTQYITTCFVHTRTIHITGVPTGNAQCNENKLIVINHAIDWLLMVYSIECAYALCFRILIMSITCLGTPRDICIL